MNPNQPSRDEIEAKLTALLLGELPDEEAKLLRWAITQDAELAKLHDRLKLAIGLVREVTVKPTETVPLKLSDERRKQLFAHFKTPRPHESFWLKRLELPSLIPVLAALAVVALLAALLLPSLASAKRKSTRVAALSSVRMQEMSAAYAAKDEALGQATSPALPPPVAITVAPEPTLAPPPTEIVLPSPDATSAGITAQTAPVVVQPSVVTRQLFAQQNGIGQNVAFGGSPSSATESPQAPATAAIILPQGEVRVEERMPGISGSERRPQLANGRPEAETLAKVGKPLYEMGKLKEFEAKLNSAVNGDGDNRSAAYYFDFANKAANKPEVDTLGRVAQVEKPLTPPAEDKLSRENKTAPDAESSRDHGMAVAGTVRGFYDDSVSGVQKGDVGVSGGSTFASRMDGFANGVSDINGGRGASGGGGGGAAPGSPSVELNLSRLQNELPAVAPVLKPNATLAGNDSGLDRARTENQPARFGRGFPLAGPIETAGEASPMSADSFGLADRSTDLNLRARKLAVKREGPERPTPMRATQETTAINNFDFNGEIAGTPTRAGGAERFFRNPAGEVTADKPPVLGDVPMLGKLFSSRASAPAKPMKGVLDDSDADGNLARVSKMTPLPGGSSVALGVPKEEGKDPVVYNFPTEPLRQRADLSFKLLDQAPTQPAPQVQTTNAIATAGLPMNTFDRAVVATTLPALAQKTEAGKADGDAAYQAAKQRRDQLVKQHELLYAKLAAESLDYEIPKTSMVQITDTAEPAKHQTLVQKLTGEYESNARIKVESDVNDIASMNGAQTAASSSYDPYFVQTTFEIIQSDAVLGKVVEALKLDQVWAGKYGGENLKKQDVIALLKKRLKLQPVRNTRLISIGVTSDNPEEAAKIANAVADAYVKYRRDSRVQLTAAATKRLEEQLNEQEQKVLLAQAEVDRLAKASGSEPVDVVALKPAANAPVPQPEIQASENAFSTFSLNVSDVSFKLAAASLEKGQMPDAASIRSEEFINAFDYRDPEAVAGQPLAFASERARYPFAQNRDLLRFSVKTAAAGRAAGRALNLVLLLDNSGSMERADRVQIIREALRVLATQLHPQDKVSIVTFARTARLWADGVSGTDAGAELEKIGGLTPQGGTNLEEAMRLAYETARRHYLANGLNRVVLLTDGAANLGNVDAAVLKEKVEAQRKQGIALDCFGIGWEGFNDDTLEQLSRNGDGRYAFLNSPEDAAKEFAAKLAGALQIAASDVKVQVEFNPQRVVSYRQVGYAKHQLTKEQFRDNTVDAAEIAAQEAGNALYTVETKPDGSGPVATVRVRYKVPGTTDYRERSWDVPYTGNAVSLAQASAAMRLAATASAFSEWLAASPFAQEVSPDELLKTMSGVPQIYGADERPKKLEWMIRQAKSLSGK